MLDKKLIEEKYFKNGRWSLIKSENRRAELKKERRTAIKPKTVDWADLFEKSVPVAQKIIDIKQY